MVYKYVDLDNKFVEFFNDKSGFYMRTGVIENGKDTGVDPFMRNFPQLLDIGVVGFCINANQCPVGCYQGGAANNGKNMPLEMYEDIMKQCKGKVFQVALGGLGDPNHHEEFEKILGLSRINNVVPNYTTSGIGLTDRQIELTRAFVGAVAVSFYDLSHTYTALSKFINAGVKTNIHFVLSNSSIDKAINLLQNDGFPEGINAVVFLLHKPVGLGKVKDVLNINDSRVRKFFDIVNTWNGNFKLGFDACTIPSLINFTNNIDPILFDTCEGGRYSAYISSEGIMVPCSFDSSRKWGVDLNHFTIKEAWDSELFDDFRLKMSNACPDCVKKEICKGGCPIVPEIVMCDSIDRSIHV